MMKTKIIVTIGPATDSPETIKKIKESNVDFIRLNMSHGSLESLEKLIIFSKKIEMPFILDTEGSQIRTGDLKKNVIVLDEGEEIKIHKEQIIGDEKNISLKPSSVLEKLNNGDLIALDFDTLLLKVSDVSTLNQGYINTKVITGGVLGKNKSAVIDSPISNSLRLPVLSEKDLKAIEIGLKHGVDHIAASFMRTGEDVDEVREKTKGKMKIISKIETKESMGHLDSIIEKSDYCLIDRGDLSKEISLEKIPLTQKIILNRARKLKVPVFIATNLLESMIENPKPTRAELNDIMNSLLDGASGLTLCAETAIGKYPLEAINMLNKMIKHSQLAMDYETQENSTNEVVKRLEELDYIGTGLIGGGLVEPHGGKLINRILIKPLNNDYLERLPKLKIDLDKQMDLEQIAIGTFSPLEGFMCKKDFQSVLDNMRLADGTIWTIPIIFDVNNDQAKDLTPGQTVALEGDDGIMAVFNIEEKYSYDKNETVKKLFGTEDLSHPGVARVMGMGEILLGGKIDLIKRKKTEHSEYELTPAQIRKIFEERGWSKVVGFHTRNVIHRSHEYLQLDAIEKNFCDGIFIHPVIGKKKPGDFHAKVIIQSYEKMMQGIYPKNKVIFSVFSTFSRYAGPREAIFTAICRKNFGCSHFIVGRDHTGVGNFYSPDASHKIFDKFPDLGIKPVKYNKVFYSKIYNKHIHEPDMPDHPEEHKLHISGTDARKMLENLEKPPEWFMRPEISELIIESLKNNEEVFVKNPRVVWFTGLSGSGKTTIANELKQLLQKKGKKIKIIDGDIIRNTLHKSLGFSKKDILTNNHLIAKLCKDNLTEFDFILVPIISPFIESRKNAKKMIGENNFIELYLDASLQKCIERDVKGLYDKAKKGEINNLIGFNKSNPYEAPSNPDIVLNTGNETIERCIQKTLSFLMK